MRNIHHSGKKVAARQDQERTRAENIKLGNQKKPREEISDENKRICDRRPSVAPWKLHSSERDHNRPSAQEREGDRERDSTFGLSSGQVRQDDIMLVSWLVQRTLPPLRRHGESLGFLY
jgi:hypothetical protein